MGSRETEVAFLELKKELEKVDEIIALDGASRRPDWLEDLKISKESPAYPTVEEILQEVLPLLVEKLKSWNVNAATGPACLRVKCNQEEATTDDCINKSLRAWKNMQDDLAEPMLGLLLYRTLTAVGKDLYETDVSLVDLKTELEKVDGIQAVPFSTEKIFQVALPALMQKLQSKHLHVDVKPACLSVTCTADFEAVLTGSSA